MIQKVLLAMHATGWLIAVVVVVWRTGQVPPELWAVLPFGISAILIAFRAGDPLPTRRPKRTDKE